MIAAMIAVLALQGGVMLFDEFYFHFRRGLSRWERMGHPIDTFFYLVCYAFVLLLPYSETNLWWFTFAAVFSTLLVTKDEFIHATHCDGREQWLHALLFVTHPVALILLGAFWAGGWTAGASSVAFVLVAGQAGLMTLFLLYQIIYWNFLWTRPQQ